MVLSKIWGVAVVNEQDNHDRQRLDSPLVYVGAHNVYYVKLPVKVLYFTIHIHTQINQYVVISDFPPVSVEKFNLCSVMAHHRP